MRHPATLSRMTCRGIQQGAAARPCPRTRAHPAHSAGVASTSLSWAVSCRRLVRQCCQKKSCWEWTCSLYAGLTMAALNSGLCSRSSILRACGYLEGEKHLVGGVKGAGAGSGHEPGLGPGSHRGEQVSSRR